VVEYLVAAAELPGDHSLVYEIGGPDRLSYLDLVRTYAEVNGLRRLFVAVPTVPVPAADLWRRSLESVAPERVNVSLRLAESLRNDSVVEDDSASRDFAVAPTPVVEALRAATAGAAAAS
jgi:uncharacterized protein YbjT (DUF2867 family)